MLKRTELKRKTPLARQRVAVAKNSIRLRHTASRKASAVRKANEQRAAFVREMSACMCGCGRRAEVCHEMSRGGSRGVSIFHRCAWLALNEVCHGRLHRENWSMARQLALKLAFDGDYYDRSKVLELKRVADTFTTAAEVEIEIAKLKGNQP